MTEAIIDIENINPVDLFGSNNSNIEIFKKHFPLVKVLIRGSTIKLSGLEEQVKEAKAKLLSIIHLIEKGGYIPASIMEDLFHHESNNSLTHSAFTDETIILFGTNGKIIRSRTVNQKKMVDSSEKNDIVFATGPAGTGKTYTAVALAVKALKNKLVKKIILTRPAIEAGENLGFLPGDLKEKIDPYLRPLYDALEDMIPIEKLASLMSNKVIEVAPLAYMRGRTLDNAFIILDEAQNTNDLQLKMFLTRIGANAKAIITGDPTQNDLPYNQKSGLDKAIHILQSIEGIAHVVLTEEDVVRHKLVKQIIKAYQNSQKT
ncbi:MAG: PhoH family protein [Phycisphaerales bacterium]|nr:PhoH family protein [Phycisphaerales bacterium]